MKLFEMGISRSMRARWIVSELGADCELVHVNMMEGEHKKQSFLKMNPCGKVPTLQDGDFFLFESMAIVNYLCEKYPEKNLIPKSGTHQRALYDQWMSFASTELDALLWHGEKNSWIYPEEKRSEDQITLVYNELRENFKVIENELKDKDYITGDFQGVDALIWHCCHWARGRKVLSMDDYPNIQAYIERCKERAHFPREIYEKK